MTQTMAPSTNNSDELKHCDIVAVARRLGLDVREKSDGHYCPCPVTQHSKDAKNPKCKLGGDNPHCWDCFKCEAEGDPVGLVKAVKGCDAAAAFQWLRDNHFLSDNDSSRPAAPPQDPITQLCQLRGWKPAALDALNVETTGRNVKFPMRDHEGTITGYKSRRADNKPFSTRDGDEVKSLTGGGEKLSLMYPDGLADAPDPVVICEGEADAAAALSAGHEAVVATAGATAGRRARGFLSKLVGGRDVVLAPDPDTAGRMWRDKIGETLANAQCGVRIITPGDRDLDDRLKYEDADLGELIADAQPWQPPEAEADVYFNGNSFVPLRLAAKLADEHTLRFGYDPQNGDGGLMRWTGTVWKPAVCLGKRAQQMLGERMRRRHISETLAALRNHVDWTAWGEWDRLPERYIACQNGLVDLETGHIKPHEPKHLYRSCIPWDYRQDAKNERLSKALRDLFPDEEVKITALKLAGYCLVPHTRAKVFAFLHGDTDSGKTTFLEWLRGLVGRGAYAAKTPQQLTENRFAPAALEGKLLCAPDELTRLDLQSVERLKNLSGGSDTFDCEHKGQDSYEAPMTATLVFACNDLPTGAGEADNAYYNRLLILPFENAFPDGDSALRDTWKKKAEYMEPFLSLAVDGLRVLRADDWKIDKPAATEEEVQEYRSVNDPLAAFIEARCTVDPDATIKRSAFCDAVGRYCKERGQAPPNRKKICRRLREEWHITEPVRHGIVYIKGVRPTL